MVLAIKPKASLNFQANMGDCSDLDSDSASECPPSKRRSLAGAATYKSRFNTAWTKEFDFILAVKGEVDMLGFDHSP